MKTAPVLLLLLVLTSFAPVFGENQQKTPPPLQHEVRVALKLVQVIVTDRRGRPVLDLGPADFEIRDNGKIVATTVFEKHFLPSAEDAAVERPGVRPTPPIGGREAGPAETGRKFFILIDVQQSDVIGYGQAKKAALHFLNTRIVPGDEVGVLSFQARRGLIMHAFLSRDYAHIEKIIKDIRAIPGYGGEGLVTDPYEKEDAAAFLLDLEMAPLNPGADEAAARRMAYVGILRELAKALRSVPGTKNIVFFSAGYARSTLESDVLFQKAFEDMAKEFAASSSPVFTVDVMGLRAVGTPLEARGDHSLKTLSADSGGRFFADVARVEDVAAGIQGVTANYYVLGYSIGEEWDGRRHEIEVSVKREGCLVSAPSGYFSPKPFADFTDFEKQIHLYDAVFNEHPQFETPVELSAALLPWRDETGSHLLFLTELPWTGLPDVVLPQAELFSVLLDAENRIVKMKRGEFAAPDVEKKRAFYYEVSSPPPGVAGSIFLIRNTVTGHTARARISTTAAPPPGPGLEIDAPLLLVSEADRDVVFLKLTNAESPKDLAPAPGIKEVFPFLSNRYAPVLDEVRAGTKTMFVLVRTRVSGIPNAQVEFTTVIRDETKAEDIEVESTIADIKTQGLSNVLLLELPLPPLYPGRYVLTVVAREDTTGARIEVRRTFRMI